MLFEPTRAAAWARVMAVDPQAYARTRNALDGAVTQLSPYLTHGLVHLREVYQAVHARHPLHRQHKFVFELGWRAYWRHVWAHRGDGIQQSLHTGPLPDAAYRTVLPVDVSEASTGVPAIDLAIRTLYTSGYLHNHARMWLASYLVHVRKVHWHTGAQWMQGYLLDGDVASNHLSWQWVAGTGSHKPYLFNAENVAKYAPPPWHSFGTVIDTTYEALEAIARSPAPVDPQPQVVPSKEGVLQPDCSVAPDDRVWVQPDSALVRGRDVWLHHPWAVHVDSALCTPDTVHIGVGVPSCHANLPWSPQRWAFVTQALLCYTPHLWWDTVQTLAQALQDARRVRWYSEPHMDAALAAVGRLLPAGAATGQEPPPLFAPVSQPCQSFSEWWKRTALL